MKNIIFTVAMLLLVNINISAQGSFAKLSGKIDLLNDGDSVTLIVDRYGQPNFRDFQTIYSDRILNHSFEFKIPSETFPLRFHLVFSKKNDSYENINSYLRLNLRGYYMESGDDIYMSNSSDGTSVFKGNGHEKFYIIKHLRDINALVTKGVRFAFPPDTKLYFEKTDSASLQEMAYLNSQKHLISRNLFELLRSEIIGSVISKGNFLYMMTDSMRREALGVLADYHRKLPLYLTAYRNLDTVAILKYGDQIAGGIISKYIFDSCYVSHRPLKVEKCYDYIVNNIGGILRERSIITLLYRYRTQKGDISACVDDAFNYVHDGDLITILQKLKNNSTKGAQAYNFSLPDIKGQEHSLSEYKGKIVFIDFWFTGCGNCIRVAPYLKNIEAKFAGKPVVFLSVNLDTHKKQWINSVHTGKYTSKYVTNLFTDGKAFEHPISKFYSVDAGPTLIMIDKNGRLMANPLDPRNDGGKSISASINEELQN